MVFLVAANVTEDLSWLQTNIQPWSEVKTKWLTTFNKRREDILKPLATTAKRVKLIRSVRVALDSIHDYMNIYPALQQPLGINLVILYCQSTFTFFA